MVKLSTRLQSLFNMVTPGYVICDIGCDHGFLSIALIEQGVCPFAYAMDLRKDPLARAREHIEEAGLSDKIELRLSDGAEKLKKEEAESVVIAGMGGNVMMHILENGKEVLSSVKELILQPQSELKGFREYLFKEGYRLIAEDMVEEDGKYYPMMKMSPPGEINGENAWDTKPEEKDFLYGPLLLKKRHHVLYEYLQRELGIKKEILSGLPEKRHQRAEEVKESIHLIESILEVW